MHAVEHSFELAPAVVPSGRYAGFYWVNYVGIWEVAQWDGWHWYLTGNTNKFNDDDFVTIGDRVSRVRVFS